MYCRSCGMNSLDANVCEWCKQPIAGGQTPAAQPAAQPVPQHAVQCPAAAPPTPLELTQPVAPPLYLTQPVAPSLDLTQPVAPSLDLTQPVSHGGNVRMSLTGEIVEVAPPANRSVPGTYTPPGGPMPPLPNVPPTSNRAVVRELPPGAINPHMVQASLQQDVVTLGEKWEKCLAMLLPLLLLAVLGVHFVPTAYLWIELGALFISALVMGASGAISSYDEAFAECTGVLVISFFFGPLVGFAGYFLVGLIRQEMTAAINFLLLVHIAARFMFILSAGTLQGVSLYGPDGDWAMLLPHLSLFSASGFISFFVICSTFSGWMMSSFFRQVNE